MVDKNIDSERENDKLFYKMLHNKPHYDPNSTSMPPNENITVTTKDGKKIDLDTVYYSENNNDPKPTFNKKLKRENKVETVRNQLLTLYKKDFKPAELNINSVIDGKNSEEVLRFSLPKDGKSFNALFLKIEKENKREDTNSALKLMSLARNEERKGNLHESEIHAFDAAIKAENLGYRGGKNPFQEKAEPMLHRQFNKGIDGKDFLDNASKTNIKNGTVYTDIHESKKLKFIENNEEKSISVVESGSLPIKKIPEELNNKYLITGDNSKGKYYYKEKPDLEAFRDTGEKITTNSSAISIAKSMILLAEAKQWESIKLMGSEKFKREVWMEAKLHNMEVSGYKPSAQDIQNLNVKLKTTENTIVNNSPALKTSRSSDVTNNEHKESVKSSSTSNLSKSQLSTTDRKILEIRDRVNNNNLEDSTKKDDLRSAYLELSKNKAIKKFPELAPLYKLERAASNFANDEKNKTRFDDRGKQQFIASVREKALDTLNRGGQLTNIKQKPVAVEKTKERDVSR